MKCTSKKRERILLLALCIPCIMPAAPPAHGHWQMTFDDEFNGSSLDTKVWEVEAGSPTHILSSRWPDNIQVKDGICRLITRKETRGGKEWTTANFWTRTFRQKYGYFEARYRYGAATGLNNAFWLMTRPGEDIANKFELDINEGHYPSEIAMNVHQWLGTHWSDSKKWPSTEDLSKDFHIYGLEWNAKELIWYFDGAVIRRRVNDIAYGEVPVLLSTAVLKWAGEVTDKLDGTSMDVDYVRIYRRLDGGSNTANVPDFSAMIQPVPESGKFTQPGYYVWGASMTRSDDGKYHLFYSRWPQRLGFSAWVTNSEVAHAVGESEEGPFHFVDVALPPRGKDYWDGLCTHNPTVKRFDGKYYLYYMGNTGDGKPKASLNFTHRNNQRIGVAVADTPDGPWKRFDKPVIDVSPDPNAPDALCIANPSITQRPGGGFLMVYKAVGRKRPLPFGGPVVHLTATATAPTGPFHKQLQPIFTMPSVDFPAEDPFVWYDYAAHRYLAIVKDNNGYFTRAGKALVLWESADGFDWKLSAHPLVTTPEVTWADGRKQKLHSLERPQLYFSPDGRPSVLLGAVDETDARTHSFNVRIPLRGN